MPSHKIHRLVDRVFLGKEFPDVHIWMDEPAKWLGKRHRILRHDPLSIVARYWDDPERLLSAFLHIVTDGVFSSCLYRQYPQRRRRSAGLRR